jgi:hypothetical protein
MVIAGLSLGLKVKIGEIPGSFASLTKSCSDRTHSGLSLKAAIEKLFFPKASVNLPWNFDK